MKKYRTYRTYWYCDIHDDAYFMKNTCIVNPFKYNTYIKCCSSETMCSLSYIGYRGYENETVIIESLPEESWFYIRGGGFEKKYLDKVDEIKMKILKNEF